MVHLCWWQSCIDRFAIIWSRNVQSIKKQLSCIRNQPKLILLNSIITELITKSGIVVSTTTIHNILHRTANRALPTSSPLAALPQLFATYFSDKISKLHFNLQTNPSPTPAHSLPPSPPPLLHSLTPATLLEIDNLLSNHLIHTVISILFLPPY